MSQTGAHHSEDGFVADKVKKAEKRIEASPFDTEAWSILIRDAQIRTIEQARPVYERLVTQFGNAGRYWKIYIEHEVTKTAIKAWMGLKFSKIEHGSMELAALECLKNLHRPLMGVML